MASDEQTNEWLAKLRTLAFNTPFGSQVKITVGVTPRVGERLAQEFGVIRLLGGLDGQGRPTFAFEAAPGAVMIEWLAPHARVEPKYDPLPSTGERSAGPSTWGSMPQPPIRKKPPEKE